MHFPVLKKEVLQYLNPQENENFIDCTFGLGGHSIAILEMNAPKGKVLGIELDKDLYNRLQLEEIKKNKPEFQDRLILVNDSYLNLKEIVKRNNFYPVNGILFDLGFSSWHLEESKKGFSFLRDEVLDMRYDSKNKSEKLTAEKIINKYSLKEIEKILREYGEEKFSHRISVGIVRARKIKPIKTTFQLVEIIKRAVPGYYLKRRIHPATKTFQALRIAVNNELKNIEEGLDNAFEVLNTRGRLVVISFHSLEDRVVKNFFKKKSKENLIKIITKKPVTPSVLETKLNPASRSAKLRAVIKII